MPGLATVTNVLASMVTRHGLSCIQPSATSLSSVHLAGSHCTYVRFHFVKMSVNLNVVFSSVMNPTSDTNL
jgi:hypothetical protein